MRRGFFRCASPLLSVLLFPSASRGKIFRPLFHRSGKGAFFRPPAFSVLFPFCVLVLLRVSIHYLQIFSFGVIPFVLFIKYCFHGFRFCAIQTFFSLFYGRRYCPAAARPPTQKKRRRRILLGRFPVHIYHNMSWLFSIFHLFDNHFFK